MLTKRDKPIRILVVEDNILQRKVLVEYLTRLGVETLEADSGIGALAVVGSQSLNAVLLDISLPDIDGFEVLRRMKTDPALASIPVIITTVHDDRETILECMKLRVDDYIIKPVDPVVLEARLDDLLNRAGRGRTSDLPSTKLSSLSRSGVGRHFLVAAFLISLVPALAIAYILVASSIDINVSDIMVKGVLLMVLVMLGTGYALLAKYPISIVRLRRYLTLLAKGSFPKEIDLSREEDDLKAIGVCLTSIIQQTQDRVRTIEEQAKSLVAAEAQRVMIESLGAACHHLAQPATVLRTGLELIGRQPLPQDTAKVLESCVRASNSIADILSRLQDVNQYQTEPYLTSEGSDKDRILRIPGGDCKMEENSVTPALSAPPGDKPSPE